MSNNISISLYNILGDTQIKQQMLETLTTTMANKTAKPAYLDWGTPVNMLVKFINIYCSILFNIVFFSIS